MDDLGVVHAAKHSRLIDGARENLEPRRRVFFSPFSRNSTTRPFARKPKDCGPVRCGGRRFLSLDAREALSASFRSPTVINPKVGHSLLYCPASGDPEFSAMRGPFAAIVSQVHGNDFVNVVAFTGSGEAVGRVNVVLLQEDDENVPAASGAHCKWDPDFKKEAIEKIRLANR
jgi:hypothetical protein